MNAKDEHPSYGMFGVSRVHGGAISLFCSSVKHNNTIRIRICRGSVCRELNRNWYHGRPTPQSKT